jgi:cell division protein YceG involved in septum cleavage
MLYLGKHHRIKSELRFTVFLLVCIIFLILSMQGLLGMDKAAGTIQKTYQTVEIKSGDTLWNIAGQYAPENMDIRKAVYQLEKLNGISATELMPGMEIQIPNY